MTQTDTIQTHTTVVVTNSLHRQAVCQPGKRVSVEGNAADGTVEAISIVRLHSSPSVCSGTPTTMWRKTR